MTAHVNEFVRAMLPPHEQWPHFLFDGPDLEFSAELNCADELLDRHIRDGHGAARCIVEPALEWTYTDLQVYANRIARVLTEDMGVVPGDPVLLRGYNSAMLAASWFAVMKAGAVAVTTMPLYRRTELQSIQEKLQIRHALCDVRLRDELDATENSVNLSMRCWGSGELESALESKATDFDTVRTASDDIAIVGFTSGTTGKPKAAAHFHRDILATCRTYGTHVLQPRTGDLFTGSPPLGFTFGLGGLLLFPLYCGAATLLLEKAPPEPLLQAIQEHRVSVVFTAPVAYRLMADLAPKYDIGSLRKCVSAGETLPKPVFDRFHDATGLKILDGIGSTEMLHIFVGSPEDRVIAGSTGQAVPGYVAQIHDDHGNELPPGEVGRLAVKGPTGCRYLDDERQLQYVRNGWNYPGDAYRMDENGYFWYVARTDDMIIAAGYNISGPEVEQALLAHADVKECAVVAKPDPRRDTNIVKAYVVLVESAAPGDETAAQLQEFVRSRIASFKAPREIEFVSELPRTETGKVQRFRLRERAATEE